MAVLEKIRQRKKILAIVIGGALLAFIVEVGFEALGRQAGNTTAAKVGSEKIDIMSFQNRVQKESDMEQASGRQVTTDPAVRQQQVLEEMITEKLLEQEYEAVGIAVTDNEITELMTGKNPTPQAVQFAQQCGVATPAELNKVLNDPKNVNNPEAQAQLAEIKMRWSELTNDVVEQYKAYKLQNLVMGCLQANDLDREQMVDEQNNIAYINFVKKDFASLADDKYPVSDAEIKAEWDKNKQLFALEEELRAIHFIAVPINPSKEDIDLAKKVADQAYAALQKGNGIDSVRVLGSVKVEAGNKVEASQLPAGVKSFAQNSEVGATMRDTTTAPGQYKMFKLTAKEVSLDSVKASFVAVPGAKAAQDSALAMLKAGKPAAEVTKAFKDAQAQEDQWIRVASYPDSIKSRVANAGAEYVVYDSNPQGAVFIKVAEKKPAKTFYTVATVSHEAYAGQKTGEDLRNKLEQYLSKNKNIADFIKNAASAGYNAIETVVTPNTPQLGMSNYGMGIKDTRKAIKWAFENKKGVVSPVFTDNNDYLIVVAIDDIYDGDYRPHTDKDIKEFLTAKVRNAKKGDDLMKQFNGKAKDLNGYAKVMGSKVDTTQVIFGNDMTPMLADEPGIIGRVAAAKQGQVVGLWKGQNGVYAFQVTKVEKSERKMTKEELNMRYAQSHGVNMQYLMAALAKATKIERNLINFY